MTIARHFIILLFAILFLGAGCGKMQQETMFDLHGTPGFDTLDSKRGVIRGTYESDGYRIHFEAMRGAASPLWARLLMDAPKHDIDARFCDDIGFCFALAVGGHAFADPEWSQAQEALVPDDKRARQNMETVWNFHQDAELLMQNSGPFRGLEEEMKSLYNLSNIPPSQWGGAPAVPLQSNP